MNLYKARVKFADEEWLVVDTFKYNDKSYMYLSKDIDGDTFKNSDIKKYKDKMEFIFIEKLENGNFSEIIDNDTINELCDIITERNFKVNNN